jgi:ornithine cyclodeaminase/alanine dehydrogenase-like protein (mu-crystallin family)
MLILNADEVRRALPMPQAIVAMKHAFAAFSAGQVDVPQRVHLPVRPNSGVTLIMSAFVNDADPHEQALAVKVVSLFDNNRRQGLARIQAAVMVLDPATGRIVALLEGAALTSIRTAAASAAATDLLAKRESRTMALFGAGVQARAHVEAICAVRPIETVFVYGTTPDHVATLIEEFARRPGMRVNLQAADSPAHAVHRADIVCATTTSPLPIFNDADLPPGVHINAIGSFRPQVREIPAETVVRATIVVDSRAAAWEEAGDLIQPLQAGLIQRNHIHAELGELVLGRRSGRTDDRAVTLFKSVGLAVQDAAAARVALENASQMLLGQQVPL